MNKVYFVIDERDGEFIFWDERNLEEIKQYFSYEMDDFESVEMEAEYNQYIENLSKCTDLREIEECMLEYDGECYYWFVEYENSEVVYDSRPKTRRHINLCIY